MSVATICGNRQRVKSASHAANADRVLIVVIVPDWTVAPTAEVILVVLRRAIVFGAEVSLRPNAQDARGRRATHNAAGGGSRTATWSILRRIVSKVEK